MISVNDVAGNIWQAQPAAPLCSADRVLWTSPTRFPRWSKGAVIQCLADVSRHVIGSFCYQEKRVHMRG
jgi:hypothetical protein